jgi:hypothetical protein
MDLLSLFSARYGVLSQPAGRYGPWELPADRITGLAPFLASLGFTRGAEIGVQRAHYSEVLAAAIPGLELLAVDPWLDYPGYEENIAQGRQDGYYAEAQWRLTPERFPGRTFQLLRATSLEGASGVPDGYLDFVYIDGNHKFDYLVADLAAWSPKVRAGGLICGHDYCDPKQKHRAYFHVKQAVNGWVDSYRISPWFIWRADSSASFMWERA